MIDYDVIAEYALGAKRCAKRTVVAVIIHEKNVFVGYNSCEKPKWFCPRRFVPGADYTFCKTLCKQTAHAEINAIKSAGTFAKGSTMLLIGHEHPCEDCQKAIDESGIEQVIVIPGRIK